MFPYILWINGHEDVAGFYRIAEVYEAFGDAPVYLEGKDGFIFASDCARIGVGPTRFIRTDRYGPYIRNGLGGEKDLVESAPQKDEEEERGNQGNPFFMMGHIGFDLIHGLGLLSALFMGVMTKSMSSSRTSSVGL